MLVCGVDDAGRGSVLGPLVIAGIVIKRTKINQLKKQGIRDSKKLTPLARERLYKKIINIVDDYYVTRISPKIIDKSVFNHSLNHLEARYMAKVISKLSPSIAFVDSCDVNPHRFGKEISKLTFRSKIKSYHHADSKFVVVSAASILAKVSRDRAITKLKKKYNIGSGYPSDPKTKAFVKKSIKRNEPLTFIRKSWKPVQILMKNKKSS
ncbi:MAG TPA: ribonuclease HII [Candidatus Nitrosopelagicus sp.]|jgi:ribonuclease HII|nr:ribonuclease HII [Marine Group I thaumarchaeote]HIC05642.1 ribonuclease HII [Candidatus Nitrosopelagicus sp.]|tara:strand:- start:181 stop:807 length:627 start_codon:yes stop_codon:yes gene_type:complete